VESYPNNLTPSATGRGESSCLLGSIVDFFTSRSTRFMNSISIQHIGFQLLVEIEFVNRRQREARVVS